MKEEAEKRAEELVKWSKSRLSDENSVDKVLERIEHIFEKRTDADFDVIKTAICKILAEVISKLQNTDNIKRLKKAADMCNSAEMYEEGKALLQRSVSIQEERNETQTEDFAESMHILAYNYENTGHREESIDTYKKSIEIFHKMGKENTKTNAYNHNNLAGVYYSLGQLSDAESAYLRSLEIKKRIAGEDTMSYASGLHGLANVYDSLGQLSDAESAYLHSLEIRKRISGEDTLSYASGLHGLANVYFSLGRLSYAESTYLHSLEIQKRIAGEDTMSYVSGLHGLANVYDSLGRLSDAESTYLRSLEIKKRIAGEDTMSYASGLYGLANVYDSLGRLSDAESTYLRSLEIEKRIAGEDTMSYASGLHGLANVYFRLGRLSDAESTYLRSLEIQKRIAGEDTMSYVSGLHGLANVYDSLGRLSDAESTYLRSLEIKKRIAGEDTMSYASGLHGLANVYDSLGRLSDAESTYLRSLEIQKRIAGEDTMSYASGLHGLANVYNRLGRLSDAESTYLRSLEIQKRIAGEDTMSYASGLHGLANVYDRQGRLSDAESTYLRSLEIEKRIAGEDTMSYASGLHGLANVYDSLGRLSDAESTYLRSLEIQKRIAGEDTMSYASGLHGLANVYDSLGRLSDAESTYLRSLEIEKRIAGEDTMSYSSGLHGLANVYNRLGRLSDAESTYLRSLEIEKRIAGEDTMSYASGLHCLANVYDNLGRLSDAESTYLRSLEIQKRIAGEDTMSYAISSSMLAMLYLKMGETDSAYLYANKAADICRSILSGLNLTSSRESIYSVNSKFSTYYQLLISLIDKEDKKESHAIELVASRKTSEMHVSRFRDEIQDRYATKEEKHKLETLEKELLEVQAKKNRTDGVQNQELISKEEEKRREYFLIESDIMDRARKDAGFEGKLAPQGFYLEDEIVLDYCWYIDYASDDRTPKYCVIVYKPGYEKDGDIIFLGDAEDIDSAIKDLRDKLLSENEEQEKKDRSDAEASRKKNELYDPEDRLYKLIYEPLLEKVQELKDASRITICADGELTKLPFELIIPDKQIRYLTSGTDGEWIGLSQTKNSDDIVSGNPVCGEAQGSYKDNNNNSRAGFPMSDLKYSGPECERIEKMLNARSKGEDKYLVQAEFRKENVMKISRPRIWHISTHGFFYENEERGNWLETQNLHPFEQQLICLQDPYRRCGLALFRANRAMEGPEEAEKVLLTGRDILELDLTGTDLIVLSACQTALGDVHNGDGIWGLQRAFMLAGVKTLIMSLWSVDDLATSIIFCKFYEHLLEGRRIDESLQEAKRYVRESTREEFKKDGWAVDANKDIGKQYEAPFYWAGFICLGEGGNVNIN